MENKDLSNIEAWLKNTTEEMTDWDWDGKTLTVFNDNDKTEKYSKKDLKDLRIID